MRIVFSFVKSMVCLTVLFFNNQSLYCSTFQTFMVSVRWGGGGGGGGQDLSILYLKQSFSAV